MDRFLDRYQVPKLNQDQINDLKSLISPKEKKESLIVSQQKKKPMTRWINKIKRPPTARHGGTRL
jgi:hypothetical protein